MHECSERYALLGPGDWVPHKVDKLQELLIKTSFMSVYQCCLVPQCFERYDPFTLHYICKVDSQPPQSRCDLQTVRESRLHKQKRPSTRVHTRLDISCVQGYTLTNKINKKYPSSYFLFQTAFRRLTLPPSSGK